VTVCGTRATKTDEMTGINMFTSHALARVSKVAELSVK
jgi:hypothetical protein